MARASTTVEDPAATAIEQRVVPTAVRPRSWGPAMWGIGLLFMVVAVIASAR